MREKNSPFAYTLKKGALLHKKHLFVVDKNLRFPVHNFLWQDFFHKFNVIHSAYIDIRQMTQEMKTHAVLLSYLPAAAYFGLRKDPFYHPIANALFASNHESKINSVLIVSKKSPINNLEDLKGKTYGYINQYCTSSYFAPAIFLKKHGFSFHEFFGSTQAVGPWQLQIDAVTHGEVDATMVQEDLWLKLPENAEKTKIIGKEENLPSPLIVSAKNTEETLLKEFQEILFSPKSEPSLHALFSGFIPYQKSQVETFFSSAQQAFQ